MPTSSLPPELVRAKPIETIRAFSAGITADGPAGVPGTCICTWVPRYGRWALKYMNHDCTARHPIG